MAVAPIMQTSSPLQYKALAEGAGRQLDVDTIDSLWKP